ncbi:uncharacterized protein LOC111716018 [Eurytemora carolleeae]|uniref:uncharacterized protein LOC111716018 n=1 Tax=Eurytemora carolleeae TaxID=1294199 RepID=UPI000C78B39C|nr:uncharacterized protein LOC111716018 [Eurytemora carolleeae]|eukprot:XP_023347198.1 uncharacterized protein LOC111716018 [Eurytemora affinis]
MLPTMVANTLGYLTIFFEEEAFEAALGVNLTIVLVIVTMLVEIGKEYAKTTSYIMVQLWMIVSVMMPFLEVVLQTYAFHLRKSSKKVNDEIPKKTGMKHWISDEGLAKQKDSVLNIEEVRNRKLRVITWILKKGILVGYLSFVAIFFITGMVSKEAALDEKTNE